MTIEDPIIITGCPRSGTSLTAGIIAACGAFGRDLRPADQHNPKGYFENPDIAEILDGAARRHALAKLFQTHKIVDEGDPGIEVEAIRGEIGQQLYLQQYPGGPWYCLNALNDPKTIQAIYPNAKWVLVRRNEDDARASISRVRHFFEARGVTDKAGYFLQKAEAFKSEGIEHIEVWPFETLAGGVEGFRPMIERLGLVWHDAAVRAFADPSLVHNDSQGYFPAEIG